MVIYDDEEYKVSNLKVALENTGIIEIESYLSKVSTKEKTIRVRRNDHE